MNETRTFTRAFAWLAVSAAFFAAFIVAGRWSISPLDFGGVGNWLDETEPIDAFVEVARWIGIVLAGYVVAVSLLVLASQFAAAVRLVSLSRLLSKTSRAFAVPIIRKRLVEASTATVLTASVVSLTAGGFASAAGAVPIDTTEQTIDSANDLPGADVVEPAPAVEDGDTVVVTVKRNDTLTKLARAQYGDGVDSTTTDWLAIVNDLDNKHLIFPGQQLRFPPLGSQTLPTPAVEDVSWTTYTTKKNDSVWNIIEARYGVVTADMVWTIADLNNLENPHEIAIGMQMVLPPMSDAGKLVTERLAPPEPPARAEVEVPVIDVVNEAVESDVAAATEVATRIPTEDWVDKAVPDEATAVVTTSEISEPSDLSVLPAPTVEDSAGAVATGAAGRWASALPWAGAGAGTLLTLAGLISWRRRRRRSEILADGGTDSSDFDVAPLTKLHQFDTLVDLPLAEWAAAGLSELATEQVDATLATATFGNDGLNVVWRSPVVPREPWVAQNETAWALDRAVALAPGDAGYRAAGFPLLVTVGRRNDEHVLVNLAVFSPLAVHGGRAEELVGSIIAELATGGDLSDGLVRAIDVTLPDFVDFDRVRSVSATQLLASTPSAAGRPTLTVVDASHEQLAEIVAHADSIAGDAVIVLGESGLCEATLEVTPGSATLKPADIVFDPAAAPVIVERTRTTSLASSSAVEVDEIEVDEVEVGAWTIDDDVDEARQSVLTSPTQPLLLRVFSPRLPSLDPKIERLRDPQIRVLAALDSFGTVSQTPERLAERLGVSAKTVRTYGSPLRAEELELLESDGKTWSLSDIIMSDVAWIEQRADAARRHPEREGVAMNLDIVWEMLERITGPAYGAASGSKEWAWVFDQEEPPCPADMAWNRLCSSVQTAVEVWDKLAVERDDDISSAGTVVSLLVRAEKAIGHVEPWPLLRAAAIAARRGPDSGRQQIALRLAQLAANGSMVPENLVDEVVE